MNLEITTFSDNNEKSHVIAAQWQEFITKRLAYAIKANRFKDAFNNKRDELSLEFAHDNNLHYKFTPPDTLYFHEKMQSLEQTKEALEGLIQLGFVKSDCESVIDKLEIKETDKACDIIKMALPYLTKVK